MMGNCDFASPHWWGGWMGHAPWLILLAVAAGLTAWLLFRRSKGGNPAADRSDSLEILKTRLVRGEITVEEYNALKSAL